MELKKSEIADLEKKRGVFLKLGLAIVLLVVIIAFEWASKPEYISTLGEEELLDIEEEMVPITRQQETPPPPPPPAVEPEELNIVEDDADIEDELEIKDQEADQETEVEIVEFDIEEEEVEEEEVFFIVEDMPKFNGKDYQKAFLQYIHNNLKYPEIAAENGISGRVIVQFTVNSKGKVVDTVIMRSVDPSLDKEALRVVNTSPSWTPGKQRNKPVSVRFTFPINFVLQ